MQTFTREQLIQRAKLSSDATFRAKFLDVPHYLTLWLSEAGGLANKRVMDFGCGGGITAASVALTCSPSLVVATDINDEYRASLPELERHLGIEDLPPNLAFEQVTAGALPSASQFDIIYSWSVFEHVDRRLLDCVVRHLRDKLVEEGILFIQIAPLYYSSEGAHLMHYGVTNWEHLSLQTNHLHDLVFGAKEVDIKTKEADWGCFLTLNRITVDELVSGITGNGFDLVRLYTTKDEKSPPAQLSSIFSKDVLTTNQVVALFRKSN